MLVVMSSVMVLNGWKRGKATARTAPWKACEDNAASRGTRDGWGPGPKRVHPRKGRDVELARGSNQDLFS